MTDAEQKLLDLAIAGSTHDYRGNPTKEWDEAVKNVLEERCTPEMKEKYRELFNAYRDLYAEFSRFADTVPDQMHQAWFDEMQKERQ